MSLSRLNALLGKAEGRVFTALATRVPELDRRVADPADWLDDYEIQLQLSLYVPEGDPLHAPEEGGLVHELSLDPRAWIRRGDADAWRTGVDHAEPGLPRDFPEPECLLYHCLRRHEGVPARVLSRIDRIWLDLLILEQLVLVAETTPQTKGE